jgi:hypothetical protein
MKSFSKPAFCLASIFHFGGTIFLGIAGFGAAMDGFNPHSHGSGHDINFVNTVTRIWNFPAMALVTYIPVLMPAYLFLLVGWSLTVGYWVGRIYNRLPGNRVSK